MTDEEVKKGLECCAVEVKCNACPYVTDRNCREQLNTDALALINRLEKENKKLSDKNKELRALCREKSNGMKLDKWVRMLQEADYGVKLVENDNEQIEVLRNRINRLESDLYCAEAKAQGKTAKDILQSLAQFRAVSPTLSKTWYALAEKYGVEVDK